MAKEDLLAQMLIQLTQKESPPPPDDNTLIQKTVAPNDAISTDDSNLVLTKATPASFKWSGKVNGVYQSGGWTWGRGQYKPISQKKQVNAADQVTLNDSGVTLTLLNPSTFKWAGIVNGAYQNGGWKWNAGQYKPIH